MSDAPVFQENRFALLMGCCESRRMFSMTYQRSKPNYSRPSAKQRKQSNPMQKGLSLITHNGITVAELYGSKVAIIDMNAGTIHLNSHGWTTRSTTKAM